MPDTPKITASTPAPGCSACSSGHLHTPEDWKYHPFAGHVFGATEEGIGWSHPDLAKEAEERRSS